MMIPDSDFYWSIGIFEGEGCFAWYGYPVATMVSTDRDVIERFGAIYEARKSNLWIGIIKISKRK